MAPCDQGYLCDVCGEEVPELTNSDLYLRYILGEIDSRALLSSPERHLRCNPVQSQFIVNDDFPSVVVEGPFNKRELDSDDVERREARVTRAWQRLQDVQELGIPISEYPLTATNRETVSRDHSADGD